MDIPKPMAPVLGVPLLERLVDLLRQQGILDIVMLIHHRADVVRSHFDSGERFGVRVRYVEESSPRGTGGALVDAIPILAEQFLVIYGDTLVEMDFSRMLAFHINRAADATLFAHPNDHPQDSDLLEIDHEGRVTGLHPYPHPDGHDFRNLVNAGLYVMKRRVLETTWPEQAFDIAKQAVPRWVADGARIFAYRGDGYIKDMGTPERLARVEEQLRNGTVARKSGKSPRVVVFLDRDGTLNLEKGHLSNPDQLELFPGVGGAVRALNHAGIPAIVVTNQPVIARGEADFADVEAIHRRMEKILASEGAFLDAIFYCPHHPDKGFPGERNELKMACDCRKPGTAMVEEACRIFEIDRTNSWFIGDTTLDMECARRSGIQGILVKTGMAGRDGKFPESSTFKAASLVQAIDSVLARVEAAATLHNQLDL